MQALKGGLKARTDQRKRKTGVRVITTIFLISDFIPNFVSLPFLPPKLYRQTDFGDDHHSDACLTNEHWMTAPTP